MPNWCYNSVEARGPKDEINAFVNGINGEGEKKSILHTYYPMPEELNILSGFMSEDSEGYAEWKQAQESNLTKYGFTDWYEWQYEKWGTKWGDRCLEIHDTYEKEDGTAVVSFQYETAWGPAEKAFLHISTLFPNIRWDFHYDEEAGFFCGNVVMRNGEILFDKMFSPSDDYEGELDWNNPDSVDAYDDWKTNKTIEIEMEAEGVK